MEPDKPRSVIRFCHMPGTQYLDNLLLFVGLDLMEPKYLELWEHVGEDTWWPDYQVSLQHLCQLVCICVSGYGDFRAGVSFHPATTFIAETVNKEEVYEVLDEVQCPQMMLTPGNDHVNEKPGGLANKVWG